MPGLLDCVVTVALGLSAALHGGAGSRQAPSSPDDGLQAAQEACLTITNDYRRSVGRAPLTRDADLDAFAEAAGRHDVRVGRTHAYFRKTRGGGLSRAENQVPAWPLARHGSALEVVTQGLAMMWNEGPRGSHRRAMADASYTRLGCAVIVADARVTVVQEFR